MSLGNLTVAENKLSMTNRVNKNTQETIQNERNPMARRWHNLNMEKER